MALRIFGFFILTLLVSACASQSAVDPHAEGSELEQRQEAFLSALYRQDATQVAEHFAQEGVLHVANMPPIEGRESIAAFYANVFRYLNYSMATPQTLRMSSAADMAHATGKVTNVFAGSDGPQEYHGKFLIVWEQEAGEWLVRLYAVSNNRSQ